MRDNLGIINVILNLITLTGVAWITYVFYWVRKREGHQWELFQKLDDVVKSIERKNK